MRAKRRRDRNRPFPGEPAALLSVLVAAMRTGDKDLARAARQELADRHGIQVTFLRNRPSEQGVAHVASLERMEATQ